MSSADISGIFNDYDIFWRWFFILHAICSVFYGLIFYFIFMNAEKKGESPKDCLLISTCSISLIHSHICCIGVVIGFFVDGLYKAEHYMISPPGAIAIVWMLWNSYMLTDLIAHILCFYLKPIPPQYDVIFHHMAAYTTMYLLNFPIPIYGWLILCAPLITEFSTIFMNWRWFAKHYNYSEAIKYYLDTLFLVTWFVVRLPAIFALLLYNIINWNTIYTLIPLRVAICATILMFGIVLLHIIWAYLLINKIRNNRNKQQQLNRVNQITQTETDSLL